MTALNPYEFHPGVVKGVFRIRNIRETSAVPDSSDGVKKQNGDPTSTTTASCGR